MRHQKQMKSMLSLGRESADRRGRSGRRSVRNDQRVFSPGKSLLRLVVTSRASESVR